MCVGFSHVCMFNDINDNTAYPSHNSLCILFSSLNVMFLIAIHAACTQVTAENMLETDHLVLRSRPESCTWCRFQCKVTCSNIPGHHYYMVFLLFSLPRSTESRYPAMWSVIYLFEPLIWGLQLLLVPPWCHSPCCPSTLSQRSSKPSWALVCICWPWGLMSPEGPVSLLIPSSVRRPLMLLSHFPCATFLSLAGDSQTTWGGISCWIQPLQMPSLLITCSLVLLQKYSFFM